MDSQVNSGLPGVGAGQDRMNKTNYETDDKAFPADAYTVSGYRGIAWHVYGWETRPDADTEWTGIEERTGRVVAVMIGDDRKFTFDVDEITPITSDEYCGGCGQIGCTAGR